MNDENELIVDVGPLMVWPATASDGSPGRPVIFTANDLLMIPTGVGPRQMLVADGTEVIIFDDEIEPFDAPKKKLDFWKDSMADWHEPFFIGGGGFDADKGNTDD